MTPIMPDAGASRRRTPAVHRELRFRPYDSSRDYLTSQPAFDERLLALHEQLHGACSPDPERVWSWSRWRRQRQYQARLQGVGKVLKGDA